MPVPADHILERVERVIYLWLLREAQMDIVLWGFIGFELEDRLSDHSSQARIQQCWSKERFREIFWCTVRGYLDARVGQGGGVHVDASLSGVDVNRVSLMERHVDEVMT